MSVAWLDADQLQWLGAVTRPFRAIATAVRSALTADDDLASDDDLDHDSVVEQDKLQDDTASAPGDDDDLGPAADDSATPAPDDSNPREENLDSAGEKEEEGMWEESFKSHRDSKPHGEFIDSTSAQKLFPSFDSV